jgi:nucleoside-diphosphate-sugar epimerase
MRVLVTGHHGYLGSVTAPALQQAGHEVVGVDARLYRGCDLGRPNRAAVQGRTMDIRDVRTNDLRGFDAVVHLAALSNDPLGDFDPELTREVNFRASVRLAEAARDAGVRRFVFASSCSMYGAADTERGIDESAPLAPLTAYAESKVHSEQAIRELAGDEFTPVFMRNATAFGASPRIRLDVVLNNLVAWGVTTGSIRILSDGTPWRPLVHVADIATATAAILEAPRSVVHNEAFNIGRNDQNYQVGELAEIVATVVPGTSVEFAGRGDPDPRSYRVDFGKFARAFPETHLSWTAHDGALEIASALRQANVTREIFESDRFVRLRRLRSLLEEGRIDDSLRWRDAAATTAVSG